jgi:repressor LexA
VETGARGIKERPMKALTKRQQEVLDYLKHYLGEKGFSPSIREIASHFGISYTAMYQRIQFMALKGAISYDRGKARTLKPCISRVV